MRATVLVIAIASLACAHRQPTRSEVLLGLTRKYEAMMGVGRHVVTFVEPGQKAAWPWCAYSGGYKPVPQTTVLGSGEATRADIERLTRVLQLNPPPPAWIEYDLNPKCDGEDPVDMAIHEVCHQRMRHHEMDDLVEADPTTRNLMEEEAEECVKWYRKIETE